MYVKKERQRLLIPNVISSRANHTAPLQLQFQYTGTKDYAPFISIADALEFRERIGGDEAIQVSPSLSGTLSVPCTNLW